MKLRQLFRLSLFSFFTLLLSSNVPASPSSDPGPQACDVQEASQSLPLVTLNSSTCLNGVSGGLFGTEGNRNIVNNLANDLNSRDSDSETAFLGDSNLQGLAAGDHFSGWGIWATASYLDYEGNNRLLNPTNAVTRLVYQADTKSILFGADRFVSDKLVVGLSAGYEDTNVFTLFNGGNTESDGFTVAPYAAYLINDTFSVDLALGYSSLENDTDRLELGTGSTLVAEYDSDRWFITTNINAATTYNDWYLSGRVGWLYSAEEQDAYTETGSTGGAGNRSVGERDVWISQIIVAGEAAYNFGRQEPYFGIAYVNDLSRGLGTGAGGLPGGGSSVPVFDDDDEVQLNAGIRMYADRFTAVLDLTHTVSRNNFDSTGVMFTVRTDL